MQSLSSVCRRPSFDACKLKTFTNACLEWSAPGRIFPGNFPRRSQIFKCNDISKQQGKWMFKRDAYFVSYRFLRIGNIKTTARAQTTEIKLCVHIATPPGRRQVACFNIMLD